MGLVALLTLVAVVAFMAFGKAGLARNLPPSTLTKLGQKPWLQA
jgi:hypothetical protein